MHGVESAFPSLLPSDFLLRPQSRLGVNLNMRLNNGINNRLAGCIISLELPVKPLKLEKALVVC